MTSLNQVISGESKSLVPGLSDSIDVIEPNWEISQEISSSSKADLKLCWTCGACNNGCPVHIATGRLSPQHSVRMATFGMLEELLAGPQIWYCLSCRRCLQGCPNRVKPYLLHHYLQYEAIHRGYYTTNFIADYRKLFAYFQRVRWRTIAFCFKEKLDFISDSTWHQWLTKPLRRGLYHPIHFGSRQRYLHKNKFEVFSQSNQCFTCSECSGCCPVMGEDNIFDPKRIIREVNFGLSEEVVRSPAIWLCLGCQRCSEACPQTVKGHNIIQQLQQEAIDRGFVPPHFPLRLQAAERIIYPRFLDAIDTLLKLHGKEFKSSTDQAMRWRK